MCRQHEQVLEELAAIRVQLDRIERQGDRIMTEAQNTQQDVDAATAELAQVAADVQSVTEQLGTDFTAVQAELLKLQNQPGVDTTALDAAVAQAAQTLAGLDPAVAQISSLAPASPPAGS